MPRANCRTAGWGSILCTGLLPGLGAPLSLPRARLTASRQEYAPIVGAVIASVRARAQPPRCPQPAIGGHADRAARRGPAGGRLRGAAPPLQVRLLRLRLQPEAPRRGARRLAAEPRRAVAVQDRRRVQPVAALCTPRPLHSLPARPAPAAWETPASADGRLRVWPGRGARPRRGRSRSSSARPSSRSGSATGGANCPGPPGAVKWPWRVAQ
jgi:hypothetical protein